MVNLGSSDMKMMISGVDESLDQLTTESSYLKIKKSQRSN